MIDTLPLAAKVAIHSARHALQWVSLGGLDSYGSNRKQKYLNNWNERNDVTLTLRSLVSPWNFKGEGVDFQTNNDWRPSARVLPSAPCHGLERE